MVVIIKNIDIVVCDFADLGCKVFTDTSFHEYISYNYDNRHSSARSCYFLKKAYMKKL